MAQLHSVFVGILLAALFLTVGGAPMARADPPRRPINTLAQLSAAAKACWHPPALDRARDGMMVTVRFSLTRDGVIFGKVIVSFESRDASDADRLAYRRSIGEALERCSPFPVTEGLGNAIAGRPLTITFVDGRRQRQAGRAEIGWPNRSALRKIAPLQRGGSTMSFRIIGLPATQFADLFALSDAELAAHGAVRQIADARSPGYPCRVSLTDATAGEELLLVNYEHHAVASPYRMRFAIYVRKGEETYDRVDEVPDQLRRRPLAVRAFNADAMMVGRELVEGRDLEPAIERLLSDPRAAYLHIHFAAPGCYAARVERA
jgi:hypothetical protein